MTEKPTIEVDGVTISANHQPYFIADIAANHDGELSKAKELIFLASEAGANAVKFQHFSAETLVSDVGFRDLGGVFSHQKSWKKSVYEVYQDASLDLSWTSELAATAREAGVTFMSTPYSVELAEHINPHVPAFKIGSGDLNYHQLITFVAATGKPWMLATGASNLLEVKAAVSAAAPNPFGVIMQCNTNYTGSQENFRYINLNVLRTYSEEFPEYVLGLSDHTPGHATVLGAIALGARVFEKHFTDNNNLDGPDHAFSMTPVTWSEMVARSNELFVSLGHGEKLVEQNEVETVVLQRRCIRAAKDIEIGATLQEEDLSFLRPAPADSISPNYLGSVIGRVSRNMITEGTALTWSDLT